MHKKTPAVIETLSRRRRSIYITISAIDRCRISVRREEPSYEAETRRRGEEEQQQDDDEDDVGGGRCGGGQWLQHQNILPSCTPPCAAFIYTCVNVYAARRRG